MVHSILIIEGDPAHAESLKGFLSEEGYTTHFFLSGSEGFSFIMNNRPDLVILDTTLKDGDGFLILKKLRHHFPDLPILMITGYGSVESAVRAMKLGVLDYLIKPINYDVLKMIVRRGLIEIQQKTRKQTVLQKRKQHYNFNHIIGKSPVLQNVIEKVKKIAETKAPTILIQGESGTGKELIAKALHYNSKQYTKAFVEINCAAIPEGLLEAELFGHEKGAFTGAFKEKKGLLEIADNGTLFLDEIGYMPLSLQSKLVKVIEDKTYRRVGGVQTKYFNSRIIAASNVNIQKEVEKGKFRLDLYYRLNLVTIALPSLKERGDKDILLLAHHFLNKFCEEYHRDIKGFTDAAKKQLIRYNWPGNVRQLRNVIERSVILGTSEWIDCDLLELQEESKHPSSSFQDNEWTIDIPDSGINLDNLIKHLFFKAMKKAKGNKSNAAKLLGISRDTFRYRWEKYQKS